LTIDLHIHSSSSDGKFNAQEILKEARIRGLSFLSITNHDNISDQTQAISQAKKADINYVSGVELNVTFTYQKYRDGKPFSLDFLGYQFNPDNQTLQDKLTQIAHYRQVRAAKILENLNTEFKKENIPALTEDDLHKIEETAEGSLGRPHIADYLIKKQIVANRQEAFEKYLMKCDVPKYPLHLEEASKLIRDAGGKLVLAHPTDICGTSLHPITPVSQKQTRIIQETMLHYIDGIECWHPSHSIETTNHYIKFAKENNLLMTGGSDCHQKPVIMGIVKIPSWVTAQFC